MRMHLDYPTQRKPSPLVVPTVSNCHSDPKPNLILSAVDGVKWEDQIFIFMQSLEVALGRESLEAQRAGHCPSARIDVKIVVPSYLAQDLAPSFKALQHRYPTLNFVGGLPYIENIPVVLTRFQGWADYLELMYTKYDKVLTCDLDIVFQRNPFNIPLKPDVELLYFTEWRGLKIGQCMFHMQWFNWCTDAPGGPYITSEQIEAYKPLDRICAGSVYGTARAMHVYMDTMATELAGTDHQCNDQAMHIHLYYSSILETNLRAKELGGVTLVPNEDSLLGTVGTTPMVTYNEWGEILNERGEVQYAVHQYKHHWRLREIVQKRFGWMADVGSAVPDVADLDEVEDRLDEEGKFEGNEEEGTDSDQDDNSVSKHLRAHKHSAHSHSSNWQEAGGEPYKQFILVNVSIETCKEDDSLCSCINDDCQIHYENFT